MTCGVSVRRFPYTSVEYSAVAKITCKLNRYKKVSFVALSFASPEYGYISIFPAAPSTGHDYLATGG